MKKLNKIVIIIGFLAPLFSQAESTAVAPAKPADLPTYTLIDTVGITTYNGLKCELAVAMSVDRKDIRIIRLDLRKGIYNVNYFAKKPSLFSKQGVQHILADEVDLKGQSVSTMQSTVDFDKGHKDVILKIQLANDQMVEKRIDIEADFFKDNSSRCLK